MSLGELSSVAYNNVLYFVIVGICDVEGLERVDEVSKHLRLLSLKTCDMLAD